ncbi:DUF6350 family protein [Salinifilum aidingensis]
MAVCLATLLLSYLLVAALLACVVGAAEGSQFEPPMILLGAVVAWLSCFQVPLTLDGLALGVLPLLPTALVAVLIATAASAYARRCRLRRPDQAGPVVLTFGVGYAIPAGLAAFLIGPHAAPAPAFACAGLLATAAAAAGVAPRCGLLYQLWAHVPEDVWAGVRAGLLGLGAVLAAGAGVVLVALGAALPELAELYGSGTWGAGFGMTALSLVYLPNAVVAGWSFAAGTGFEIGRASVGPWHLATGDVPRFPLTDLLPAGGPHAWWSAMVLLAAAAGVLVGVLCRRALLDVVERLRAAGVAAVVIALGVLLLAWLAGGTVADGPLSPVDLGPVVLALATFGWTAVPAAVLAFLPPAPELADPELVGEPEGTGEDLLDEDAAAEGPGSGDSPAEELREAPPEELAPELVAEIPADSAEEVAAGPGTADEPAEGPGGAASLRGERLTTPSAAVEPEPDELDADPTDRRLS